jgi:hypothetical protein
LLHAVVRAVGHFSRADPGNFSAAPKGKVDEHHLPPGTRLLAPTTLITCSARERSNVARNLTKHNNTHTEYRETERGCDTPVP